MDPSIRLNGVDLHVWIVPLQASDGVIDALERLWKWCENVTGRLPSFVVNSLERCNVSVASEVGGKVPCVEDSRVGSCCRVSH